MLTWAVDRGRLPTNHLKGFKRLHGADRADKIWQARHIEAFLSVAPPEMQLALVLALHTGQRQGDIRRLAWSAYDGQRITLRQGKAKRQGQASRLVVVPCTKALKDSLNRAPRRAAVILATKTVRAYTKRYFSAPRLLVRISGKFRFGVSPVLPRTRPAARAMPIHRITKRTVDALQPTVGEFTLWDDSVSGFGVRVRPSGAKSYMVVYRAGPGRGAPVRRYTIAGDGKITAERARARAKAILGAVAHGQGPANQKTEERGIRTVAEVADRFMADHVRTKRKAETAEFYRDILDRIVKPTLGTTKADKLTRAQVGKLHCSLADTPFQANRMLAVVGSMYAFAGRTAIVPEGTNPARGIDRFKESRRERFLTVEELAVC
jgi:Arm DNA-binding domain